MSDDNNDKTGQNNEQNDEYNGNNFAGQDEDTALDNYSMHDAGEALTQQKLNELGLEWTDECGFDGREFVEESDEYDKISEIPDELVDDVADLQLTNNPDVLVDIKTTSYKQYIGNMEKTAWYKHKNQVQNGKEVIIVCFALDDANEVIKAGCYRMSQMESTGGNPAGQRYFKHCNQSEIKGLEALGQVVNEALEFTN